MPQTGGVRIRTLIRFVLLFVPAIPLPAMSADFQVVTHAGTPGNTITRSHLRGIFGLRADKWPDNQPIKVFVLADNNPIHIGFVKSVLGIYPYQLRQSWDRLVYSGFAQSPTLVDNEQEMLQRIAETPGAIGYLREAIMGDKVHALSVLER